VASHAQLTTITVELHNWIVIFRTAKCGYEIEQQFFCCPHALQVHL